MYDENFKFALERYKRELMEFAKLNKITLIDIPDENAVSVMSESLEDFSESIIGNQEFIPMKEQNRESDLNFEKKRYNTYDDFLAENPKTGSLRVQTFVAGRAFPVGNARVTVTKQIADGEYKVAERMTDSSGIAQNIILPTPESNLSETPVTTQVPYSTYDVLVEHPRYRTFLFRDVPVFDSIESIQPVEMRPRVEGENNDTIVVGEVERENLSREAE